MFTSNKKTRAVGASVFMLVEFLSLFIRWIARRSLYDSYSALVLFSKPFLKFPCFDLCKTITIFHGNTDKRAHTFSLLLPAFTLSNVHFHTQYNKYIYFYTIHTTYTYLWEKHKFVDALSFLFHFLEKKRIRTSSSLNDLLSYVHEYFWWANLSFL